MNIYIVGKMASGKTTMADLIIREHPKFKRISLAEPIKDIVYNIDKMSDEELIKNFISPYYKLSDRQRTAFARILFETRYIPKDGGKERKRLQFLGTEGGRERIDQDIWVKILIKKYKDGNHIVDDCRFINEAQTFYNSGWTPIFLLVSKEEQIERLKKLYGAKFSTDMLKHQSEIEIDEILIPTKSVVVSQKNKVYTLHLILNKLGKLGA